MKNIHQKIGTIMGYTGASIMLIALMLFMADMLSSNLFLSRHHSISQIMIVVAITALGGVIMAMGVQLRDSENGSKGDKYE